MELPSSSGRWYFVLSGSSNTTRSPGVGDPPTSTSDRESATVVRTRTPLWTPWDTPPPSSHLPTPLHPHLADVCLLDVKVKDKGGLMTSLGDPTTPAWYEVRDRTSQRKSPGPGTQSRLTLLLDSILTHTRGPTGTRRYTWPARESRRGPVCRPCRPRPKRLRPH